MITHKGFGHERGFQGDTNIWLTPKYITDALGPFDLDPCSAPDPRPWNIAVKHIILPENGLVSQWQGFCFVNPHMDQIQKTGFKNFPNIQTAA